MRETPYALGRLVVVAVIVGLVARIIFTVAFTEYVAAEGKTGMLAGHTPSIAGYVLLAMCVDIYYPREYVSSSGHIKERLESLVLCLIVVQFLLANLWIYYILQKLTGAHHFALMGALNVGLVPSIALAAFERFTKPFDEPPLAASLRNLIAAAARGFRAFRNALASGFDVFVHGFIDFLNALRLRIIWLGSEWNWFIGWLRPQETIALNDPEMALNVSVSSGANEREAPNHSTNCASSP